MSKDSSYTFLHFRASHHADLFEDFCHSPSSRQDNPNNASTPSNTVTTPAGVSSTDPNNQMNPRDPQDNTLIHVPGHFLPFEEIMLPHHLMPLNPEDEDGVVPDMHAAFGIEGALGRGGMGTRQDVSGEGRVGDGGIGRATITEPGWRDLGLRELADGSGRLGGRTGERPLQREGRREPVRMLR